MEGLSVAANGLAVISVAFQLTEACIKLYTFWETVEDAPLEIAAIKEDLRYLISVFKRIESHEHPVGSCLAEGIHHCRAKIADLTHIVERFDDGFHSLSRRKRVRTAFKAAIHNKHVQRFRDSLNDTKTTLTLAMVHESVIQPVDEMMTEHSSIGFGVHELMLHAIAQTAVTTFDSTSMEIFAQDGYTIDKCEDSLIFDLCRTGQTRAVEALLEKGMASVVDTSPKGWKPLHFAAAAGHVELCELLIKGGADKSALVYEGPSDAILSPISLFVASCTDEHADTKIAMLRLFCECIDIADTDSDGWTVHDWLKRAYARERVPISRNSITWLLHLTVNEDRYLEQILNLSGDERLKVSKRHMDALGSWLALRMKGFDWMEDNLTHKQFLQALPSIYSAWCKALLECIEQVKAHMREELDRYLCQLGMTRDAFVWTLTHTKSIAIDVNAKKPPSTACTHCGDEYGLLACGLVEPARIAVTECVKIAHHSDCVCGNIHKDFTAHEELLEYTGKYVTDDNEPDVNANDEFFDAHPYVFNDTDLQSCSNLFTDIATLLYSAQGRIWLGEHSVGERLCSTCFLLKEKYIGEDGLSADFPPMPRSFEGLRVKW
ncbi:hypothetical protein E8E12_004361 [Didymella heteroderae]|uniref:Fungal N-terminal domain-containing protein n=1 Tax=Didymella heteroderae TaxID=1769908 RepID=A0A9P4WK49_9PLEO|nr:hypothetical protein E8E12_004361 [Didymella heteroderae]